MDISEEKILIENCIVGDKQAWDRFVENYSKLIYYSVLKTLNKFGYVTAQNLVEDLYQEVFLSLLKDDYKKLKTIKWRCSLSPWLCVVAKNLVLNFMRKDSKSSRMTDSLFESVKGTEDLLLIDTIRTDLPNSSDLLEKEDMINLLKLNIGKLSVGDRTVLDMFYFQELPLHEIAKLLGKSTDAVFMQKKRVIEKLQKDFVGI